MEHYYTTVLVLVANTSANVFSFSATGTGQLVKEIGKSYYRYRSRSLVTGMTMSQYWYGE